MAIGTTDISMDAIATELKIGTGSYTNDSMYNVIYYTSQYAFNTSSGSYHNLNMALPGLTDSFATSVETWWSGGLNMGLKNWAGYDHDANLMLSINIINNSVDPIDCAIEVAANPGPIGGGIIVLTTTVPPFGSYINTSFNTGVPAWSNFGGNGDYNINARFNDRIGTRAVMDVTNANDDDGVGPDTTRSWYPFTWDLVASGPFDDNIVTGANGWPPGPPFISWNKRTRFNVTFT